MKEYPGSEGEILLNQRRRLLIVMAALVFLFGVSIYLLDRNPASVYFIPAFLSPHTGQTHLFGALGYQLPTFIHVYVFILITALVTRQSVYSFAIITLSWLLIDSALELAQHADVSPLLLSYIPAWVQGIPVLENIPAYFRSGTFDVLDIYSIISGALAAFISLLISKSWGVKSCYIKTELSEKSFAQPH